MTSPRAALGRVFGSLAVRNFRLFFVGQAVSLVGSWAQTTGVSWLVLKLTGSPLALGTVTALQFVPVALLTLFGGVLADRAPKRRLLVAVQSIALVQATVLGLLVAWDVVELWHVYALAALGGAVMAIEVPTRQAFVIELVGREMLPNAVALHSSIFSAARVLGPGLGGLAIAAFGTEATFLANAVSFLAVILAYALMRSEELHPSGPSPSDAGVLHQVGQALAYSWRTPPVMLVFVLIAFLGTFAFNFTVVVPLVAEFVLRVGPEKFGLLSSCLGLGSVVAALTQAIVARASTRVLLGAAFAFVGCVGLVALSRSYLLTGALLFAVGLGAVTFTTNANTLLQLTVPDELRARVMSVYFFLFAGSTPIGGWFTGVVAEHWSVPAAVAIDAGLAGLGCLVALGYRGRHAAAFTT
ncbi:MAG: MFS transporter [Deltaproteobacteria bacterium]|nr:MFS transporter [Deltaproteobacteria bacterium]